MHKLFAKQLAKATKPSGEVDVALLGQLVSAAFEEADSDRRRTDRSISLMVEELDELNRDLESKIVQRTSELKQREAELRLQNMRFNAALENMPQGLCMFDHDKRLVVSNVQYAKIYGLDPEELKIGTPLRTILERRVATGQSPENSHKYIEQRLVEVEKSAHVTVNELKDGRFIEVKHRPLTDGGWVAIHDDVTVQKRSEERISHMAHHDALTDLPNRLMLREQLDLHMHAVRHGASLAVLCLDLDLFKRVNDTLGHPVGDALLCAIGRRLRECVRESDVVARLGGDEFAIIQAGVPQPISASVLAQRLVDEMAKPFVADGHEIVIGTSIGISVAPNDGIDPDFLLKCADMALYRAKENGRNAFSFFESGMDAIMHERRALEIDIRKAFAADEFELFYQPLVNLERNTISGFEALLRWNHPTRGLVSPAKFIPLAEETGLIVPLGEWVLRQACVEAAKWPSDLKVAINLSPVQFRSKSLVPVVMSAIANAGISSTRVELEITEAILLHNNEATLSTLHQMRDLGVHISMDDFGTGYSSLSYLRSFPFDKIKIDRSFVQGLEKNKDAIAIIHAVSELGTSLGMTTTVEGIETKEQLELVRAEGCTEVQGYLFSKPLRTGDIPRFLSMFEGKNRAAA
ncbi:MAG TPA: EAL domain-containing protein [Rhodocyclaceae bacterium]|nr:EAL domain-containing protein [Rhodocyclaceae bacterium]